MDGRETWLASFTHCLLYMSNGWQRNQAFTHWFIIDEQWMAEKPGLQAFTHWFITDEQWMAEKPG